MAYRSLLPWPVIVIGQVTVAVLGLAVAAVLAYYAFVYYPTDLVELIGVILLIVLGVVGFKVGGNLGGVLFPGYNVAEVAVEGPITRDGGQISPTLPGQPSADQLVEQIDRANADPAVEGLLVKLNTPGGEIVPSDDIREAVQRFEGPSVAYTTDICASGGYWIASGCDAFLARDASIVGGIGVRGSRLNVSGLADRLGISHERFIAGTYKDAGTPFRELESHEREYIQSLIDSHYEAFIDRIVEGRELDEEAVRDTEARVYLGEEANDIGLVDDIGDHADAESRLAEKLDLPAVRVRQFRPEQPITVRLRSGIEKVAYAMGLGVASHLVRDEVPLPEH